MLDNSKSWVSLIWELGIFTVLCFIFWSYAIPKCIYIDSAGQIFELINKKEPIVYAYRYSMVLNQILFLVGVYLKFPLQVLIGIYSVTPVLISALCFFACKYIHPRLAIHWLCLLPFFTIHDAFFHGISEGIYLVPYAILSFSILLRALASSTPQIWYILYVISVLIMHFMHPTSLFYSLCIHATGWIVYRNQIKANLLLGMLNIAFYVGIHRIFQAAHNAQILDSLSINDAFTSFRSSMVWVYIQKEGWKSLILGWGIGLLWILRTRKHPNYLAWLFMSLSTYIVFLCITVLTFKQGDSSLALDSRLIPLNFFIALPFIFMYQAIRLPRYVIQGGIVVVLCSQLWAWHTLDKQFYGQRFQFYDALYAAAERTSTSKILLHPSPETPYQFGVTWGMSVESILYSTLTKKDVFTAYLQTNEQEFPTTLTQTKLYYVPWNPTIRLNELNPDYFKTSRFEAQSYRMCVWDKHQFVIQ